MPAAASAPHSVPLVAQVTALTEQNRQIREEVDRLQQEKKVLRLKIDALSRKLFGRSSEKLNPGQLQLLFDTLAQEALTAAAPAGEDPACAADSTPDSPPAAKPPTRNGITRMTPTPKSAAPRTEPAT